MKRYFGYIPEEDNGCNRDCSFYRQHFVFSGPNGKLEPVQTGECLFTGKPCVKDCKMYKKCKTQDFETWLDIQNRLVEIKSEMDWIESVIESLLKQK